MNESESPIRPEGSSGLCLQVFGELSISLNHSLSATWCFSTIDCMLKIFKSCVAVSLALFGWR